MAKMLRRPRREVSPGQLPLPLFAAPPTSVPPGEASRRRPASPLPPPATGPHATVAEALDEYAQYLVGAQKAPQTVSDFVGDLRQLAAAFPDRAIADLTTADLAAWLGRLERERGLTKKTIERKVSALKSFWRFALQRGLARGDAAARLLYPSLVEPPPQVLTPDELERLLSETGDRPMWQALVAVCALGGLKRDEALSLRLSDLQLEAQPPLLTIRRRKPSRYGRDRTLVVPDRLAELLRRYLPLCQGPLLFPLAIRSVQWGLSSFAQRAGIDKPVSAQVLRDTFAVRWLEERLPAERALFAAGRREELAALRARHDAQLLDILGLSPNSHETTIPRYRALLPVEIHPPPGGAAGVGEAGSAGDSTPRPGQ